jgi:hypothetical protein
VRREKYFKDHAHMDEPEVLPPGQHECDPARKDIDPVGFALSKVQTYLVWIEEHRASFEAYRDTNPADAENELHCLQDAANQAAAYFQRLKELLLAGYVIDPNKRLPPNLSQPHFRRRAESVLQKRRQ